MRRSVLVCELGGTGAGGSSAARDPGDRGRGAGDVVAGVRAALFDAGPAVDRAGAAAAGAVAAGVLRHPLGAPADGAAGLQPAVPLVRRAVDGRAGVGRDGLFEEPGSAGGRRDHGMLPAGGAAQRAGAGAAVGRSLLGRRHADRCLGVDEELPGQGRQRRRRAAGAMPSATFAATSARTRAMRRRRTPTPGSTARATGSRAVCASWAIC